MSEPPAKRSRLAENQNDGNQSANHAGVSGAAAVPKGKPPLYFSLLDDKLLAQIFSPLKLFDLLQMYEVHEAYHRVIAEDVMKNRPLDISEISKNYQTRDALRYLGGFTPEVIIKQSDIQYKKEEFSRTEEIVRLIGKRCSNGHLKKFTIVFDSKDKNANALRTEMPESMLAIDSLTIGGAKRNKQVKCDEFLAAYKERKLRSIALKNMDSPENLLKLLNTEELRELSIENCNVGTEFWTEFFQKGIPTLESFTWTSELKHVPSPIATVDIAKVFPGLKRLNIDAREIKVISLPSLKRLDVHNMEIFNGDSLNFANAMNDTANSIEELSIIKPQWCASETVEVKNTWSKAMQLAKNLRAVKIDMNHCKIDMQPMEIIKMIKSIPNVKTIEFGARKLLVRELKELVRFATVENVLLKKTEIPMARFKRLKYYWKKIPNRNVKLRFTYLQALE